MRELLTGMAISAGLLLLCAGLYFYRWPWFILGFAVFVGISWELGMIYWEDDAA